jgi:putative endonuclease
MVYFKEPMSPISESSKQLGALGEKIVSKYLKDKGYRILDRNYSPRFVSGPLQGEIDIIAKPRRKAFGFLRGKKEDTIHFIEVKTLMDGQGFLPEDKVNFAKQRKIIKTVESWLIEKKIPLDSKQQIDVISVEIDSNKKKAKIRHLKNAVFL